MLPICPPPLAIPLLDSLFPSHPPLAHLCHRSYLCSRFNDRSKCQAIPTISLVWQQIFTDLTNLLSQESVTAFKDFTMEDAVGGKPKAKKAAPKPKAGKSAEKEEASKKEAKPTASPPSPPQQSSGPPPLVPTSPLPILGRSIPLLLTRNGGLFFATSNLPVCNRSIRA